MVAAADNTLQNKRIHDALMQRLEITDRALLTPFAVYQAYTQWRAGVKTVSALKGSELTLDRATLFLRDPAHFLNMTPHVRLALPFFVGVAKDVLYASDSAVAPARTEAPPAPPAPVIRLVAATEVTAKKKRRSEADYAAQFFDLWPAAFKPISQKYQESQRAKEGDTAGLTQVAALNWLARQVSERFDRNVNYVWGNLKEIITTAGVRQPDCKQQIADILGVDVAVLFANPNPDRPCPVSGPVGSEGPPT